MTILPQFKIEFTDYDNDASFVKIRDAVSQYGFTDISWRNDTQPSLLCECKDGTEFVIWVDYSDPKLSEHCDQRLDGTYLPYILCHQSDDLGFGEDWQFHNVDELISKVAEVMEG